ncbi:hypothetical protein VB780_06610 [Leptolyngbya sp. CCNP1308]|uniref:hypothetical protein n=1 Tax=Leptolyngbya sp. CCNP1308 TaxID=3110255 RepID=UPI002B1F191F|nr:hypothetical protein [Leptolyngbya sp. CCNP1308]MEA5448234.1 hypothetical protein [Leptolyngbya sp. CCNP1308]
MIHPLVIQEDLVSRFRYWNERVQEGMHFNHELYTYFRSFSVAHRLNAYATAYEQIEQGNAVCITVSETCYIVWLCLRARAFVKSVSENLNFSSTDRASREKGSLPGQSEALDNRDIDTVQPPFPKDQPVEANSI